MIYFTLIFSLFFEVVVSNIVKINSIFIPLFLLTSLILVYPYFNNKKNYIILMAFFGMLYDVMFVNSAFISTISFFCCSFVVMLWFKMLNYNLFNSALINIVVIVLYRIITFLLLLLIGYINFNISMFLKSIYLSLIINIVYGIIVYIVLKKVNIIKKIGNV